MRIERGPGVGGDHGVRPGDRVTVGRGRECELSIRDPSLSRRHFEIWWDGNACHLRDLGSTNGTLVNGARVGETWLRDGDTIAAGDTLLRVALARPPEHEARRPPPQPAAPSARAKAARLAPAPKRKPIEIYTNVPPSAEPPPQVQPAPGTPLSALATLLAEAGDAPLWAVIDCAAALEIALRARRLGLPLYSLFDADLAPAIGHAGPTLVPLGDAPVPFLAEWAARAAEPLGVLLESPARLEDLHAHLVSLFEVADSQGNGCFRRFYDPRVLHGLLESAAPAERAAFFGPVARFVATDGNAGFVAYAARGGTHGVKSGVGDP